MKPKPLTSHHYQPPQKDTGHAYLQPGTLSPILRSRCLNTWYYAVKISFFNSIDPRHSEVAWNPFQEKKGALDIRTLFF